MDRAAQQAQAAQQIRDIAKAAGLVVGIWQDCDIATALESSDLEATPERIEDVKFQIEIRSHADDSALLNWDILESCVNGASEDWNDTEDTDTNNGEDDE